MASTTMDNHQASTTSAATSAAAATATTWFSLMIPSPVANDFWRQLWHSFGSFSLWRFATALVGWLLQPWMTLSAGQKQQQQQEYPYLANMYWQLDRVQDVVTDYKKMLANDDIVWHDFQHMIETNVGPTGWALYAAIRENWLYSRQFGRTYILDPWSRYSSRWGGWRWAMHHVHHVFVDLLLLKDLYPVVMERLAEKPKQLDFLEERYYASAITRRENNNNNEQPTTSLPKMLFPKRYTEQQMFVEPNHQMPNVVFAKSKFGAYGEGCQLLVKQNDDSRRDGDDDTTRSFTKGSNWVSVTTAPSSSSCSLFQSSSSEHGKSKQETTDSWSPLRKSFLMYEEYLVNHRVFEAELVRAGILSSNSRRALSFRVWINRFQHPKQESHVSALLIGPANNLCSNADGNECFRVVEQQYETTPTTTPTVLRGFVHGNHRHNNEKVAVEIPEYATLIACARWVHDQFPELPFLGFDFALTDAGVVFLEANPMCSYSKYSSLFQEGCVYSLHDVEAFLQHLFEKVIPQNPMLQERAEKNHDTKRLLLHHHSWHKK